MFHQASIRLALLYLLIIMCITVSFSVSLYQLSVQELSRGLQGEAIETIVVPGSLQSADQDVLEQVQAFQAKRYEHAKSRVANRLIVVNAIILVSGGALSYYLARRTLLPIERAHAAQRRFTADASHELRTPLTAIQSETEVTLMNPKLKLADAKSQLKSNLEEIAKLTTLSEGLLRLASQEEQAGEKAVEPMDVIIQRAIDRVLPLAERKNILIQPPKSTAVKVPGDIDNLVEAIIILLENAVKYSPEKSQIVVTTKVSGKNVEVAVHDQGAGIAASELPHVFDRFYRADTARSTQGIQGYGLGLAIAKNIIDQHGGIITVKSQLNKGTIFTVSMPRQ